MADAKLKVGMYWGAGCGGCDVAVLDIHEKILDLLQHVEILFWPCAMDFKVRDVEAMPERHLDVVLFNGAIRNSENESMARLLRSRTKLLVAFGACAHLGGIPGLANFWTREAVLASAFLESPSTPNPEGVTPTETYDAPEGCLRLPALFDTVKTLAQTVPVDYFVPGCPPLPSRIWDVLLTLVTGPLPPAGSVLGASDKAMCDTCPRRKSNLSFSRFVRRHLVHPDPEICLLEQGIVCMGLATRDGCGHRCIGANMPCRGCYGPPPNVIDQGAKALSAIASHVDADDPARVEEILDGIVDPAGTFYRFALPSSMLRRRVTGTVQDKPPVAGQAVGEEAR